jgi:hypothetical protein
VTPEGIVKKWVKDKFLKRYAGHIWALTAHQGPYGQKGVPDLIFCIYGLFVSIEVKTETGKLTEIQAASIKKIEVAGGLATEIYGRDEGTLNEIFATVDEIVAVMRG